MANFEPLKTLGDKSTSRAKADLILADNMKKMISGRIPDMLNLPASAIDLFHINKKETTYSEGTKTSSDVRSNKYDFIEGIPTYGVPNRRETQDGSKDDRKLQLRIDQEGQMLIPYSDVNPVPMDHFYSYSLADVNHLFVITKVERQFIIDRDFFLVTYSPSPYFKYQDILKQVVNEYVYEEDTGLGVGGKDKGFETPQILSKDGKGAREELQSKIDDLNKKYIDTFYNEKYDALIFVPQNKISELVPKKIDGVDLEQDWKELYHRRRMGFIYYSLMDLQANMPILNYSMDKNILFLEPPYPLFGAKASYKGSLYDKLIKKEFKRIGSTEPDKNPFKNRTNEFSEFIGNPSGYAFEYFKAVRDGLVFDYELKDYTVEYDYTTHFYFKLYDRHTALTRFWNSGIAINYMIHNIYNEDMYEKSACVKYTLKQNIVTKFCDLYMNSKHNEIVNNLYLLDYYVFDRENLDDYIGIPMLLLVLKLTLAEFKTNRKIYKEGA